MCFTPAAGVYRSISQKPQRSLRFVVESPLDLLTLNLNLNLNFYSLLLRGIDIYYLFVVAQTSNSDIFNNVNGENFFKNNI